MLRSLAKEYFLQDKIYSTTRLTLQHKAGALEMCREILEIIRLIAGAKLFELYKKIDPNTTNGLHPDFVLDPLKEIDEKLVKEIEELIEEWKRLKSTNNLWFFQELDKILKAHGIPTYDECYRTVA